jgi:hypothetical protein
MLTGMSLPSSVSAKTSGRGGGATTLRLGALREARSERLDKTESHPR